jgi:hypothetical protein
MFKNGWLVIIDRKAAVLAERTRILPSPQSFTEGVGVSYHNRLILGDLLTSSTQKNIRSKPSGSAKLPFDFVKSTKDGKMPEYELGRCCAGSHTHEPP